MMSALDVLPPKEWAFVQDLMLSPTHRKMFHISAAVTKVAAMFGTEDQPTDAVAVFVLLLEGLQSEDSKEYRRCEAMAEKIYNEWRASRELH